jgi:hypothetical protein
MQFTLSGKGKLSRQLGHLSLSATFYASPSSSELKVASLLNVRFLQNRFSFLTRFFIISFCAVDLMATSDDMPSETSPLLGLDGDGAASKALNGHVVSGTILDGALQDGANLERHDSIDERRAAQFEGRPDIRRQLKYILPAISIGVLKAPICLVGSC